MRCVYFAFLLCTAVLVCHADDLESLVEELPAEVGDAMHQQMAQMESFVDEEDSGPGVPVGGAPKKPPAGGKGGGKGKPPPGKPPAGKPPIGIKPPGGAIKPPGGALKPPPQQPPSGGAGPAPRKQAPVEKNPISSIAPPKANPASIARFEKQLQVAMGKMKKAKANWPSRLEKIRNGVVQLRVVQEKFLWSMPYRTPLKETVFGSGWFIDNSAFSVNTKNDVLVVTNAHVAKQAAAITVLVPALGQEPIAAEAVGICVQRDIALLRIKDPKAMFALFKQRSGSTDIIKMKLGDSDKMLRGAPIMAVGYPLGMQSVKASVGIVSGYQQFPTALYLSITAPINPGNSGGPLYNENGQVVGINSAKFAKASGISFAIPSNQLKVTLDALYANRQFVEPELGVQFSTGTDNINEFLSGAKSKGGVFVKSVMSEGLYAAAGGSKNDLILAIDNHKVDRFGKIWMKKLKDRFTMSGLLLRHKLGAPMSFHVFRSGKLLKLTTPYKATKRPKVHHIYEPIVRRPKFVSVAGFVFMPLNLNLVQTNMQANPQELVKYMKPENRDQQRILITNIVPASLAAKDGSAKKGLLVQKVNGRTVKTMAELCAALSAKVDPKDFWTIATAKSFTAFRVKDVIEYQAKHNGGNAPSNKPQFSGC